MAGAISTSSLLIIPTTYIIINVVRQNSLRFLHTVSLIPQLSPHMTESWARPGKEAIVKWYV